MIDFGSPLVEARTIQKLSRRELARRAKVSPKVITSLEIGNGTVKNWTIVANILGVEISNSGGIFGEKLKKIRIKNGLSLRETSKISCLSVAAIRRVEEGGGYIQTMKILIEKFKIQLQFSKPRPWFVSPGRTCKWDTPSTLAETIHSVIQEFDLDPCASHTSPIKSKKQYFSGGLERSWSGIVWMNPPYKESKLWVLRAATNFAQKNVKLVLGLLPCRTGTKYFQKYIFGLAHIIFLPGNLRFSDSITAARFNSCIVVWGDENLVISRMISNLVGGCMVSANVVEKNQK